LGQQCGKKAGTKAARKINSIYIFHKNAKILEKNQADIFKENLTRMAS